MNNRILALIGFVAILKALISLIPQPEGTVTVVHEEVEITFVEDTVAQVAENTDGQNLSAK
jgi:hypothetical protein